MVNKRFDMAKSDMTLGDIESVREYLESSKESDIFLHVNEA